MSDLAYPSTRPRTSPSSSEEPANARRAATAAGVAVALALAGQTALTPPGGRTGNVLVGTALYLAGALAIVVATRDVGRLGRVPDPMRVPVKAAPVTGRLRRVGGVCFWLVGLIVLALAVYVVARNQTPLAIPLWLDALLFTTLGTGLAFGFPISVPRSSEAWLEFSFVLALLAVGFSFRYVFLIWIPAQVHGDEAAVGLAARYLLATNWNDFFGLGWASLPQMSFAVYALALKYLANNLYGLRLASVIQGTLAIGLVYGVARHLFSQRVALIAGGFLACAQMAVHYSRIGNNYIGALFASMLLFYLLLEALRQRRALLFLLTGFAAGLTLSVYIAARLTLGLIALYCLHRALVEPGFVKAQWRGLLLAFFGALIFLAPQGVFYARNAGRLLDRTSEVFVLQPGNLRHEYDSYKVNTVSAVLVHQVENTIAAFNLIGESSDQYDQRAPLLDFWSGAFFVLGVAVILSRWRQPRYLLVAAWLILTLFLGSVMTIDALFSPHLAAALGILAMIPALAVDVAWRALVAGFGKPGRAIATVGTLALVVLCGYANAVDYFVIHNQAMAPNFFTVLARYVEAVNDRYQVYLLADADTSLRYDTVHFLDPSVDGVDVRNHPLNLPLARVPARKGIVFIFRDPHDPRRTAVERAYPGGVVSIQHSTDGFPEFTTYTVGHGQLLAANPTAKLESQPIPALDYGQVR